MASISVDLTESTESSIEAIAVHEEKVGLLIWASGVSVE
jgi:hypothetical protein